VDDVIKFAKVRQEPKDPKEDYDEDSEKLVKWVQAIEKLTTSNEKGARIETQRKVTRKCVRELRSQMPMTLKEPI
jgi:hypothetical protein